MTNSKRSAHNHDAAAVECKLLAKIRNFLQQRRRQLLRCMSPLKADITAVLIHVRFWGVTRTARGHALMSGFDPKRTWPRI
jgi:hypothetical protein